MTSTRLGIQALTALRRSELFATLPADVVYSFGQVAVKVFRFRFAVAESEGRTTRNAKVPCLPRLGGSNPVPDFNGSITR